MSRSDTNPQEQLERQQLDELWARATTEYEKKTGWDLFDADFADAVLECRSASDVVDLVEEQMEQFKAFRAGDGKWAAVRGVLRQIIDVLVPLNSLAGNVASLAFKGGDAVFIALGVLLTATKGVSSKFDSLQDLFDNLNRFLARLSIRLEAPLEPVSKTLITEILSHLLNILALATKLMRKSRIVHFKDALFGDNEVQTALKTLERLTTFETQLAVAVTHVTTAETLEMTKAILSNLNDLSVAGDDSKETLGQIQLNVEKLHNITVDRAVTDWLSPPDTHTKHNNVSMTQHKGTGKWLLDGQIFADWKAARNSVFWIHGKPGSGKSVLCSAVINRLQSAPSLAFFYFDFRDTAKRTTGGLLVSLVLQLASSTPECKRLLTLFHSEHTTLSSKARPSDSLLFKLLRSLLQTAGEVFIVLDALDEYPDDKREELLNLLSQIVQLNHPGLHMFATSRPEVDIRACMQKLVTHEINLHDAGKQVEDLHKYVSYVLQGETPFCNWPAEISELTLKTLTEQAFGMFRWVVCQLDTLRRCLPKHVRRTLETLPQTLDETYERILLSIDDVSAPDVFRVFQCIAFAIRPLLPEQLAEIFATEFDERSGAKLVPEYRVSDPETELLRLCSSLVEVVNDHLSQGWDPEKGHPKVLQFSHFSVKEYLSSDRLVGKAQIYRLHAGPAQDTLAELCLATMMSSIPEDDEEDTFTLNTPPLATYARFCWEYHVRAGVIGRSLYVMLHELLCTNRGSKVLQFRTWYSTPLSCAASLGLLDHVRELVCARHSDVNAIDSILGPAICSASKSGKLDVVRFLLDHGADVESSIGDGLVLHMAASSGNADLVTLLLDCGADIDAYSMSSGTALHIAASEGHEGVVLRLLERGASTEAKKVDMRSSMQLAIWNGSFTALLNHGAVVEACDCAELGTCECTVNQLAPVHLAAKNGNVDVICLLLDKGADVDARDGGNNTALHYAALMGNLDAVQLLVEHGANINSSSYTGGTAVHLAAGNNRVEILQLLLLKGANVKARMSNGTTQVHIAVGQGHVKAARMLLNYASSEEMVSLLDGRITAGRVDVHYHSLFDDGLVHHHSFMIIRDIWLDKRTDHKEVYFRNKVHVAHARIAHTHNERTFNYRSRWYPGLTPFLLAAWRNQAAALQLLREHGSNVNETAAGDTNALHLAADAGAVDAARLLLEYGLAIEAKEEQGETPLHVAAEKGQTAFVQFLLDNGADVNAQDNHLCSALHLAADGNHIETANVLLDRGATVDVRDCSAQTALVRYAAKYRDAEDSNIAYIESDYGTEDSEDSLTESTEYESNAEVRDRVARVLVEHGACLHLRDVDGFTALHHAAAKGNVGVLNVLLSFPVDSRTENHPFGTAFELATRFKHEKVARLLRGHEPEPRAALRRVRKVKSVEF